MVVLHYTAMESAEAALDRLCDPVAEVSCHYLVGRCGTVWTLVGEAHRAWHAGAGSWGGRADVNSHSIGIELDNDGTAPFSEPLMESLEALLSDVLRRNGIPPVRVIGHSDMAPGRKLDPGARFDWRRLAADGLAIWPQPESGTLPVVDMAAFCRCLSGFGYPQGGAPEVLLEAFRSRFRPWAKGALSTEDMALAHELRHRFPVDPPRGTA
ncbi:N-acetylmuramoyl-L-alanine amidase [Aliiruegeria haliotis]|nr:N-acetylmuramoyl-L-alanine amidase [Aliiruegeria haliotis]